MNRRQFLGRSARQAGALALGGAVLRVASRARAAAPGKEANPFAYDIERLAKTDPKLIQYQEAVRFPCGTPEPKRLAVGPGDRLYVAGKDGITVLDSQGNRLDQIALSSPARCVAVGRDGFVYAGLRDHIEVFNAKGQAQAAWSSPGKRTWLTGLAVGETDVFAADSGSRVLLRFDKFGKLVGQLGLKDKARNIPGLIVPSPYLDVDLGPDGLLRLNNPGRHSVEVYTLEGELELAWGKPSAAIEGFCGCCNPIGLALLPDGRCITCEKGLPRVKVYSVHGEFECVIAGPESFPQNARAGSAHDLSDGTLGGLDAAVDSQGRVYVLDLVAAEIHLLKSKA